MVRTSRLGKFSETSISVDSMFERVCDPSSTLDVVKRHTTSSKSSSYWPVSKEQVVPAVWQQLGASYVGVARSLFSQQAIPQSNGMAKAHAPTRFMTSIRIRSIFNVFCIISVILFLPTDTLFNHYNQL